MISRILIKLFEITGKFFGIQSAALPAGTPARTTAVKSDLGFWYSGNIFNHSDIVYGILRNGMVEKEETDLVLSIFKKLPADFTLYDIGANTGYYSILSGSLFPKSTIHAFEPVEEHITNLKDNVALNGTQNNVTIHSCALGEENKTEKIYLAGSGSTLQKGFGETDTAATRTIEVKNLDSLMAAEQMSAPHFIKIDVEGHELAVLKGAKNIIASAKPILFVEVAYSMRNLGRDFINDKFGETFEFLTELGYTAHILDNGTLRQFFPTEKPDGVHMYLFLDPTAHKNVLNPASK